MRLIGVRSGLVAQTVVSIPEHLPMGMASRHPSLGCFYENLGFLWWWSAGRIIDRLDYCRVEWSHSTPDFWTIEQPATTPSITLKSISIFGDKPSGIGEKRGSRAWDERYAGCRLQPYWLWFTPMAGMYSLRKIRKNWFPYQRVPVSSNLWIVATCLTMLWLIPQPVQRGEGSACCDLLVEDLISCLATGRGPSILARFPPGGLGRICRNLAFVPAAANGDTVPCGENYPSLLKVWVTASCEDIRRRNASFGRSMAQSMYTGNPDLWGDVQQTPQAYLDDI